MRHGIGVVRYLMLPSMGLVAAYFVTRWATKGGWRVRALAGLKPTTCLAALCLLGTLTFGGLVTTRYLTWHSFVDDLGSYDQKVWLVSTRRTGWAMLQQTWRGGVTVSPCGVARDWGVCHFQPLHLVPAVLYKAWASPLVLLALQVLAVMSGMIPLFALARNRLGDPVAGIAICVLFLLFPAVQYNALLDFRPDFIAIPLLLWAFLLAERGRVPFALIVAASAGLMKETLILAFAGFGLFVWLRHKRPLLGLGAFGVGVVAFYLVTFRLLVGSGSSEAEFLIGKYFSHGLTEVIRPDKLIYLGALFGPLAGVPLLSPLALLPGLPALGISLLSSDVTHASITSQYSAPLVGPLFVALLDALGPLRSRLRDRATPLPILAGLVTLNAFVSFAVGPTPLSMNFWNRTWGGHWHLSQYLPDRQAVLDRAERLIPSDPDVAVVTQNDVNSSRLAHRYAYYSFPGGIKRADYVFLDVRRLPFVYWTPEPERHRELLRDLRGSPDWRVIFEEEGVLVFRREHR